VTRRLTSVRLPGARAAGLMNDGTVSAPEMIRQYREYAERQLAEAEAILGADDAEFRVTVVDGVHVERHVRTVQEGRAK
jgi:hypothetical protein